jgi:hypothetical protein
MGELLVSLARAVIKGLLEMVAPLLAYRQGKSDAEKKNDQVIKAVLKRQRDNNISDVASADREWVRLRKKYRGLARRSSSDNP